MKKKNNQTKPLQILFNGEIMGIIEKLKANSGANSRAEVVRDAIKIYELLDNISKGENLVVHPEGVKEERILVIPRKKPSLRGGVGE